MRRYSFEIQQTITYEVVINAATLEDAEAQFDALIVDDFGQPTSSVIEYEIMELTEHCCEHDYESGCHCCAGDCVNCAPIR